MSEHNMELTVEDVDLMVYYDYMEEQKAITHLAPEDCQPGYPAECDLTGVYTMEGRGIESQWDLLQLISNDTASGIETLILESYNEQ